jgi:hypothetical protein
MTRPAEGPGTPQREMATLDRIRLTRLLRRAPARAGVFYLGLGLDVLWLDVLRRSFSRAKRTPAATSASAAQRATTAGQYDIPGERVSEARERRGLEHRFARHRFGRQYRLRGECPSHLKPSAVTRVIVVVKHPPPRTRTRTETRPAGPLVATLEKYGRPSRRMTSAMRARETESPAGSVARSATKKARLRGW